MGNNLYIVKIVAKNLDIVKLYGYDQCMAKSSYHHGDLKNALIQAGLAVLAEDGAQGLSLRKVASRAGVSHSAPYAHFTDKQALIAAISTEGFRRLQAALDAAEATAGSDPAERLVEVAWAYASFALENRDWFKVIFSGLLENQHAYPDFVAVSHENFARFEQQVVEYQRAGLVRPGPPDVTALSVWSLVHGFVSLLLEQQISSAILDRVAVKDLLRATLNHITLVELRPAGQ